MQMEMNFLCQVAIGSQQHDIVCPVRGETKQIVPELKNDSKFYFLYTSSCFNK